MKTKLLFTSILFAIFFAVDYQTEIQPIFDNNCGNCHLGNSSGGLNLSNYDNLMNGDIIVPGDHEASELYERIIRDNATSGNMPPGAAQLEDSDIALIAAWIDEGALEAEPAMVTFSVNMSSEDVGDEGPTLWMGHLYPEPGFIMTDDDGDGIWSYSLALEPGTYQYKFRNGWWDDWNAGSGWEEVPAECEVGQWGDREVVFEGDQDLVIDTVCFSSCNEECFETFYSNVTFQVDMSQQELSDTDVVYVQGTFNGWCGYCNPMSDVNTDGIWELTLELPVGEYEYLYTTNGWDGLQGGAPIGSSCDWLADDSFGNYGFVLGEDEDILLSSYCFGTCWDTCQPPSEVDITFNVDMSGTEVSTGVYMIGNYQLFPWSLSLIPTEMEDLDGDNIYSATITLESSQLVEYKFVNGNEVESNSGIGDCGNNPESDCSAPGDDCNNREFQIPDCELNENGDCVLDPVTVDAANFDSCDTVYADVNFSIDFNGSGYPNADYDQCGVNGSWNAVGDQWLGWGLLLSDEDGDGIFTGVIEDVSQGSYEFIIFCSGAGDSWSGWGATMGPPLGSECDAAPDDEFPNYGFTVIDSDIDVSYCYGSCDETCTGGGDDGGTPTEYTVTFDLDGIDDCGFVSVTGTFDNWSGWGAHTDNGMQATMPDGDYEFVVLCTTTEGEWWNDIWANSTIYNAPVDSACWNGDYDYSNYVFTVSGSDMTISYCAGTCDDTCEACLNDGDINGDGILNVVDVVQVVSHVLGNSDLGANQCHADLNGDGIVNVVDIVLMVNSILGG